MAEVGRGDGLIKLSRSGDFDAWQFKIQLHLRGLGIFSIVDNSELVVPNPVPLKPENDSGGENGSPAPTPAIDKQALHEWREYRTPRDMAVAIIIQGLTNELSKRIRKKEYLDDPALVWRQLEQDHKNKVRLGVRQLRTQLRNIRFEECRSVDVYVDKFQNLCDQIAMAGPPISDSKRFYEMMNGLPSELMVSKEIMATQVTSTEAWEELIPFFLARKPSCGRSVTSRQIACYIVSTRKKGKAGWARGTGTKSGRESSMGNVTDAARAGIGRLNTGKGGQ